MIGFISVLYSVDSVYFRPRFWLIRCLTWLTQGADGKHMGHLDKEKQKRTQRSWIQSHQTRILTNFRQNFTRLRGDTCQNFLNNTHTISFSSRLSSSYGYWVIDLHYAVLVELKYILCKYVLDESISGKCYFIYARIIHFEFAIQIKWKFRKVKPVLPNKV